MSVDISHPDILAAREAISSKTDPTAWFLSTYSTPPSALQLLSSGPQPALESIRNSLAETDEPVVFGYAEVEGKGLVIAFSRDSVGGVRRARAVVHSRAVASLFPDYAASITIAHPSQLVDEDVYEKVGLNVHSAAGPPHEMPSQNPPPTMPIDRYPAHLQRQTPADSSGPAPATYPSYAVDKPSVPEKDLPRQPDSAVTVPIQGSSSKSLSLEDTRRSDANQASAAQGNMAEDRMGESVTSAHAPSQIVGATTTPADQPGPLPLGPPVQTASYPSPRVVSEPVAHPAESRGISSDDVFDTRRQRKTSLTSRSGHLGHAFSRSSPKSPTSPASPTMNQMSHLASEGSAPSSPSGKKGPGSPNISRFINSSLVKNFGRRSSGGGAPAPASPVLPEPSRRQSDPPPLPPKNQQVGVEELATPLTQHHPSRQGSASASLVPAHGHSTPEGNHSVGTARREEDNGDASARSASAQRASFDASQKRLRDESEIQERFRRDEMERHRAKQGANGAGNGEEAVDDEYDPRKTLMGDVSLGRPIGRMGADEPMPDLTRYHSEKRYLSEEEEDLGLPYDRPDPDSPERPFNGTARLPSSASVAQDPAIPAMSQRNGDARGRHPSPPASPAPGDLARESHPHQGSGEDAAGDESVAAQIAELDLAEDGSAGGPQVEMSIKAERHAEHLREIKEVSVPTADHQSSVNDTVAGDLSREDERRAEEAESRRREQVRLEDAKRREDEQARLEEQTRVEEERRAEEERRVENERRAEEERREAERRAEEERKAEESQRAEEERLEDERRAAEERRSEQERIEAEERRLEEEERSQEARRVEEEAQRAAEEQQRLEEERWAEEKRKRDEEKLQREEEERRRVEEERRRVEEERRRVEEEQRLIEEEKQRKEGALAESRRCKREGSRMSLGWINVQTANSVMWRRRWFVSYGHEMCIFKTETDEKPLQIVPIGRGVSISQNFEESQVQNSFKLTDATGQEWSMYADGPESKEIVSSALSVASEE